MVGKTETIEDGIGGSDFAPTAKSGIHYESSNNSLYIVAKRGARRVGNGTPNGSIFKYDLDTKKTTLIKQFGQIESEGKDKVVGLVYDESDNFEILTQPFEDLEKLDLLEGKNDSL